MMKKTIVVAKYKEDLSWIEKYDNVVVIEKEVDMPNVGREPASYILYILEHYEELEGEYIFLQGDPYEHNHKLDDEIKAPMKEPFVWLSADWRTNIVCDMDGQPHDLIDINEFLKLIGVPYNKNHIVFNGCCQFKITAEQIKKYPLEFYDNLFAVLTNGNRFEYAFERCVGIIFGKDDGD